MKRLFIILTAAYLVANACSNPKESETTNIPNPAIDADRIEAIDTIMYQLGRQWRPGPGFHKVGLNARDTVEYIEPQEGNMRISSMFYTDSTATWTTFHKFNNELVLARFRQFNSAKKSVKEAICYLDKGQIFYSKERLKLLGPTDDLGSFREEAFTENARPVAELLAEYEPYWKISIEAIEKDKQSKK